MVWHKSNNKKTMYAVISTIDLSFCSFLICLPFYKKHSQSSVLCMLIPLTRGFIWRIYENVSTSSITKQLLIPPTCLQVLRIEGSKLLEQIECWHWQVITCAVTSIPWHLNCEGPSNLTGYHFSHWYGMLFLKLNMNAKFWHFPRFRGQENFSSWTSDNRQNVGQDHI